MDYFKQRRAYRQFRQNEGSVSSGQNNVYRELLDYANDEGHLDGSFKLKNSALVDWTGMTLQGVIKARNELVQKELIEYTPGIKNKTVPTYKIIKLYYTKTPQSVHQPYNNQFTNRITTGSSTVEQLVEHKDLLVLDNDQTKTNTPPTPSEGERVSVSYFEVVWDEYLHKVRGLPGGREDSRDVYNADVALGDTDQAKTMQKIADYLDWCNRSGVGEGYRWGAARWFQSHGWNEDWKNKPVEKHGKPKRVDKKPAWTQPNYEAPKKVLTDAERNALNAKIASFKREELQ